MSLTAEDKKWIAEQLRGERSWIDEQLRGERSWIAEQLRGERSWIAEQLHDVETKLLTAFHTWASPNEARQRTHAAALRAIDLEMEALNDRVTKLEDRA